MSSILKALKKLEHDKAVQKPGAFRIDADILRGGSSRRSFSSGVLLAAIAIFACGVGATYFFMKHDTSPAPAQPSQTSRNEPIREPSAVTTTVLPVSTNPAVEATLRPSEQSSPPPEKLLPIADKMKRSGQSTQQQQSQRLKSSETPPQAMPPEPRSAAPDAPPVAAAKPAVLKVDGIAFQDGGADGVAVVNGVAVSKGSVIEGARVEEIQKDRVRFSRGGEKFEIILDKSN